MPKTSQQLVLLETSSYLPLLWRTPYTLSVLEKMESWSKVADFAIQADCIREASGYLSFEDDWKYQPVVRIRRLLAKTSDVQLSKMKFPSAAIQLLLGGNIWPQGRYLNFVRHSVFFLSDLLDTITFDDPRAALSDLAEKIERRISVFRRRFKEHEEAESIQLPTRDMLPYWGVWYLPSVRQSFRIRVLDDGQNVHQVDAATRDVFHYQFAMRLRPRPVAMVVADTGFLRQARAAYPRLAVPIDCATTASAAIYE